MKVNEYIYFAFNILLTLYMLPVDIKNNKSTVKYFPVGDSYTIGEGTTNDHAWPTLLTNHLRQEGIHTTLIDNPARTGYTTLDAIQKELPLFEKSHPDFAT